MGPAGKEAFVTTCARCGAQIKEGSTVCFRCGAGLAGGGAGLLGGDAGRARPSRSGGVIMPTLMLVAIVVVAMGIGAGITWGVMATLDQSEPKAGQAGEAGNPESYTEALAEGMSLAQEAAIKQGVRAIEVAVQTSVIELGSYPSPAEVAPNGRVAAIVGVWPTNPYTDAPMQPGKGPGDYTYELTADGFKLTGYGPDGPIVEIAR